MMLEDTYRIRLEEFEGPLDLLLFLIRKDEVDIHNIPVASITEQYLQFIAELQRHAARIDIDTAGEFLVMAATLMEIKSRMLSPKTAVAPTAEGKQSKNEDPRAELVRQLLEYKQYRDAANALEHRAEDWRRRFGSAPAGVDDERLKAAIDAAPDVELEDLDLLDLVDAFRRIAETVNFDRLGEHQVTYDDTPLELHAEDIVSRIRSESPDPNHEITLQSMFERRSRGEMVGLFLALLELVRARRVAVRQDRVEGVIMLRLREPDAEAQGDEANANATPAQPE
ncbi:MAG: segregation/condensation protein A [Planctomycetes bacterium]|nr:segregation/condensation protein A [Planctomycetota bacterium]